MPWINTGKLAERKFDVACLAALAALSGCTTIPVAPAVSELNSTEWVLIGWGDSALSENFDEVPMYKYTVTLAASGQAHFKFDCDQGASTWDAQTVRQGEGYLSFGQISETGKACGNETEIERIRFDLQAMSRYTLYDGRLTISSPDSARIFVWDAVD